MTSVRLAAVQVMTQILRGQGSLSSLLPAAQQRLNDQDKRLLQELCFGSCRYHPQLDAILNQLLDKPLRGKELDVQALLLIGLYQLIHTRIPDHAAIGATVEVTREMKKPWATKLVNGVLRNFQRDSATIAEKASKIDGHSKNHPDWLVGMLKKAWPSNLADILSANDQHPPLTLRINTKKVSRESYLAALADQGVEATATNHSPYGITLAQATDITQLPFFDEGWVSVQDEAAQLSADLLQLAPNLRILDACCAPGGKTGHMLEQEPSLQVTALDAEERRLGRVRDNLARLKVEAKIICGDGTRTNWWDGQLFDRILLDAPCSATGIIRRHPDIKLLRTPEDIGKLAELQGQLLDNLWGMLKPGGVLVYATCSIMPRENTKAVEAFLTRQPDASHQLIHEGWGLEQPAGRQLLPQTSGHDGFYYAVLTKT